MTNYKYTPEQQLAAMRQVRTGRRVGKSVYDFPPAVQEANREYFLKYEEARKDRNRKDSSRPSMIIPEDGIIDWLAVDIAVRGDRVVMLTVNERSLAVARLMRQGVGCNTVAARLGINRDAAQNLMHRTRKGDREARILREIADGQLDESAA